MRYTAVAIVGFLMAGFLAGSGTGVSETAAQPPAAGRQVSPAILAFLKPVAPAEGDGELQKKLKERHNVAVKLLQERINEYKKGTRDIGPVFEAARLTAEAKLDLAENKEARTAVLQQLLAVARAIEANLEQQLAKGFGSKGDLERARFARLSVEVELLRDKQKDGPKPK